MLSKANPIMSDTPSLIERLKTLKLFLNGEGEIDRLPFGDVKPIVRTRTGAFWWRERMRADLDEAMSALSAAETRAEKAEGAANISLDTLPFWPWLWADPALDEVGTKPEMAERRLRVNYETARAPVPNQYALVHRWDINTIMHQWWTARGRASAWSRHAQRADFVLAVIAACAESRAQLAEGREKVLVEALTEALACIEIAVPVIRKYGATEIAKTFEANAVAWSAALPHVQSKEGLGGASVAESGGTASPKSDGLHSDGGRG